MQMHLDHQVPTRWNLTMQMPQRQRPVISSKPPRVTGHAVELTGRVTSSVRLESNKHPQRPDAFGRSWSDAPPCPIRIPRHAQTLSTDRTHPVKQRPRPIQRPVTSVTPVRLCFFTSGAVENRRFISRKALNPTSQARREGERNTNPSLPLKLHRLRKCANITKCTSPCVCVLAFSQSFSRR
jgi:hypothetical protein